MVCFFIYVEGKCATSGGGGDAQILHWSRTRRWQPFPPVSFQSLSVTSRSVSIKYQRRNHGGLVGLGDYPRRAPGWEAQRQRRTPTGGYVTAMSPILPETQTLVPTATESECAFLRDSVSGHSGSWSRQVQKREPVHLCPDTWFTPKNLGASPRVPPTSHSTRLISPPCVTVFKSY